MPYDIQQLSDEEKNRIYPFAISGAVSFLSGVLMLLIILAAIRWCDGTWSSIGLFSGLIVAAFLLVLNIQCYFHIRAPSDEFLIVDGKTILKPSSEIPYWGIFGKPSIISCEAKIAIQDHFLLEHSEYCFATSFNATVTIDRIFPHLIDVDGERTKFKLITDAKRIFIDQAKWFMLHKEARFTPEEFRKQLFERLNALSVDQYHFEVNHLNFEKIFVKEKQKAA